MQCTTCKSELPPKAKFCPECGTPVPVETSIIVQQDVGTVRGTVVGQSLGSAELPPDLISTTTQNVESVESGGILVGTVVGTDPQIGGQRQYGNTYTVGDITDSTGIGIGENIQVTVTQGLSGEEIAKLFVAITDKVSAMPEGPEKTMAETAVQGLEKEAGKGDDADESKVSKWMNFLAQTAYDAFEVAVATFVNPIAGLGVAFKKVADHARQEKGK